MTDEIIMAKVSAFAEELRELGVEDFIFAAGSSDGSLALQYDGDARGVAFLAMTTLMNAMFEAIEEQEMRTNYGRKNNGE